MGIAPEVLAAMVLDAKFFDYDDFIWINGDPRDHKQEPSDLKGARDWDEVRPELLALLEGKLRPTDKVGLVGDYDGPYVELDDALDAFDAELDRRIAQMPGKT